MQNNTFSRLFVGQNVVTLKQVDSTNNFLKNELAKSTPLCEGTVILAEEQFAGRGQANNTWYSEPGKNLTFSLLLSPAFLNPEKQFLLNKSLSIAINDTLTTIIGNKAKIKWPNDIYYDNDKLGGVLIENILRGNSIKYSIIGIGLNINQTQFRSDIKNVTSLKKILHRDYDIKDVLYQLCSSIEQRYLQLRAGSAELIDRDYLKGLYKLNENHRFRIGGKEREGVIKGISENGSLEVLIDGELRRYGFKEIVFV
ncbi:MAG: biotin--[acetyl-CoA-carboxylase] ligase [Sphingobacteriaceae bacterium]|nr:biotin--[acetyl-CoA-carboxylase] ligase [Sphingobacteriaceae bacterium]